MQYLPEVEAQRSFDLPPEFGGKFIEIEIPLEPERLPDECGVAGICLTEDDPRIASMFKGGLKKIQHRGQEAAGIAIVVGDEIIDLKGVGKVDVALEESDVLAMISGQLGVAQVRYGTVRGLDKTPETALLAAQPIKKKTALGTEIAVSHNGHFTNLEKLSHNAGIDSSECITDTDLLCSIFAAERPKYDSLEDTVIGVLKEVEGAYALTIASEGKLIGVRDPFGFRPLMLGTYEEGRKGHALNSESHALQAMGAEFRRELARGEMVICDDSGKLVSDFPFDRRPDKICAVEFIYLYGPQGELKGRSVHMVRKEMGRILAREHPAPGADIVIGIPDSGVPAGEGYAIESGLPYVHGIIRDKYDSDRTFIAPDQEARVIAVIKKLTVVMPEVYGKSVVLVDDSIIRGTTTRIVVKQLFKKGAREVHLRSSSPRVSNPCFMGLDTGDPSELVANVYNKVRKINKYLGSTSLGFLSIEGLNTATNAAGKMCLACFDGDYPINVPYPEKRIRRPNKNLHRVAASIVD